MDTKVMEFSDMLDCGAYTFNSELNKCKKKQINLNLFIDRKFILDIKSKGYRTSERRLMPDVSNNREGFKYGSISNIGRYNQNPTLMVG